MTATDADYITRDQAKARLDKLFEGTKYRMEAPEKAGKYSHKIIRGYNRETDGKAFVVWVHTRGRVDIVIPNETAMRISDVSILGNPQEITDSDKHYRYHSFQEILEICVQIAADDLDIDEQQSYAEKTEDELLMRLARSRVHRKPVRKQVTTEHIERDPFIREYAIRRAGGMCQLCGCEAPFLDKNGKPYLESHHIIWLSHGGEDSIENTAALCPNCHRKMHVLALEDDVRRLQECSKR